MSPQNPEDDVLYGRLERYLSGESSAAEAETVRAWIAADPEHARLVDELRLIRWVAADRPPATDVDAAWAHAAEELTLHGDPDAPDASGRGFHRLPRTRASRHLAPRPRRRPRFLSPALAAAAAVVALVGTVVVRQAVERSAHASAEPTWREYVTQPGQRANIRLRDGTHVVLAPGSRLRIGDDFGATSRDAFLEGEAFFEVVHDSARPFRVHTRGTVVEDLGTAFVIRGHADQLATEVIVAHGRVALWPADPDPASPSLRSRPSTAPVPVGHGRQPALVLGAGDLGRLDPTGAAMLERGVDVDRYVAWTRGVLVFSGTPLSEVVVTIERWYNVDIHLTDSAFAGRRLTATFDNEPIDLLLNRIALSLGLRVERADASTFSLRIDG